MMPPWKDALSEAQLQAVAEYTYNLAGTSSVRVAPTIRETQGRVLGRVVNGTANATLPDRLPVSLHVMDVNGEVQATLEGEAIDGAFSFEDVLLSTRHAYVVSAVYDNVAFVTPMLFSKEGEELDAELLIYDTTTEPSAISVDLLLNQAFPTGDGRIEFLMVMSFTNTSGRIYRRDDKLEDGRYTSVHLNLPQGARPFGIDNTRFVWDEATYTLYDTAPVLPDAPHVVYVGYHLPLQETLTVAYRVDYPMSNRAEVMLPPQAFEPLGGAWQAQGEQAFRDGTFEDYLLAPLSAGDTLTMMLTPRNAAQAGDVSGDILSWISVIAGVLCLGAAFGLWRWEQQRVR